MPVVEDIRREYHRALCSEVLVLRSGVPNIADSANAGSISISRGIVEQIGFPLSDDHLTGQAAGAAFERLTARYLEMTFAHLGHLRQGQWQFEVGTHIEAFEQYAHLDELRRLAKSNPELATSLRDIYVIAPDIVVGRSPLPDEEINLREPLLDKSNDVVAFSPLRESNIEPGARILHASISCKWTIRSDRVQNIRTEALNLIRSRKGHTPHIVAVVAEPLPTRIASIALGTGDLDCIYHFALRELRAAVLKYGNQDQGEMLETLINAHRLRDISDLPFDLAI